MAIDWSTRVNTRLKKSWSRLSGCVCSASMQIRSIAWTTSTGYLPLAVSAESITASVPSSTAFATSDTSARVGTGLEIIDSIIWVAVMVSLLCSRPSRIIFFCSAGTDLHGEIAARHHDAVGAAHDVDERAFGHRLGALDLGDEEGVAAGGTHQLPRHVHVGAGLRERHGEVIRLDLHRGPDVLHVLGGERRCGQAAALPVDALVVRQHAAVADHRLHLVAFDARDL